MGGKNVEFMKDAITKDHQYSCPFFLVYLLLQTKEIKNTRTNIGKKYKKITYYHARHVHGCHSENYLHELQNQFCKIQDFELLAKTSVTEEERTASENTFA